MKNFILLLLLIPLFVSSQTFTLKDTTYNMTLHIDNFTDEFKVALMKDMVVNSISNSSNTVTVDTLENTVEVNRMSPEGSMTLGLEITTIKEDSLYGTTYNLYDYYNGNYGFLFIKKDGTIIFSLQDMTFIDEYYGFVGFIN